MKSLTYVEIDIATCSRTYGVSPCTAAVGVTGDAKCFNTKKTCQDAAHYNAETVTLRFAIPAAYLPADIDCIPSLAAVAYSPAQISLGENLGQRATVEITFKDHRHSDVGPGFDKYVTERAYDPFKQGSFFGKFRARQPYLRGKSLRLIRGFVGQALVEMETHHFVIDSFDGPTREGAFKITAKDVLKLADDDRAQAPKLSNGLLLSNITNVATSAALSPSGIGNAEYPASGYIAIGGKEIVAFSRSGDSLTLTRGQFNTTAIAHAAESRMQLCLQYTGADPADIIRDLLVNYAGVPSSYINLTNWQTETATYLQRVYTTLIAEPTGVNALVSELVEQAALAIWWDDTSRLIKLQVLRAVSTDAAIFDESNTLRGTLQTAEQPGKRVSQVWTYYARRNPLEPLDNEDNYRSSVALIDPDAETDYGSSAIRKIYSRWIPEFGRSVANRVNAITLGRFRDPPRSFNFDVFRALGQAPVGLGGGYQIGSWAMQDALGLPALAPVQITRLKPDADKWSCEAEEVLFKNFDVVDLTNRVITIDADTYNFNLRTVHDSLYPVITSGVGVTLTCIINSGVKVGSISNNPAFSVGSWVSGLSITVINYGRLQGSGGAGAGVGRLNGEPGYTALHTRVPVTLNNAAGQIWGGGGGGQRAQGVAAGGGGAGNIPGIGGISNSPAANASNGTTEAGGPGASQGGFVGGNGGGPGLDGGAAVANADLASSPGAKGAAIDGISYVTVASAGDKRGSEVN